jgi:hypothetical protein
MKKYIKYNKDTKIVNDVFFEHQKSKMKEYELSKTESSDYDYLIEEVDKIKHKLMDESIGDKDNGFRFKVESGAVVRRTDVELHDAEYMEKYKIRAKKELKEKLKDNFLELLLEFSKTQTEMKTKWQDTKNALDLCSQDFEIKAVYDDFVSWLG